MLISDNVTSTQPVTKDRGAEATSRLRKVLRLPNLSAPELKRLSIAIAEVAAEEAEVNSQFARRIYSLYEELAPAKKVPAKPKAPLYTGDDLVPISSAVGYQINVYGPPEPEQLLKIFGKDQLPKVLSLFTTTKLKEAVAQLMEEHPGTKPKTKTKAEDLISYIVSQVTLG